nr:hypothetical protein [Candidatus Paceibacterota bacterium]
NIYIGSTIAQTWSRYFNGKMSEPRVASVARSEDWILTEYNNQNSPSTFYSIGSVSASNFSSSYTVGGNWTNTGSITPGTANVILTNSSGNGLTFAGGGAIYNNVWFNRGISTGSITISGNNTFNDFKDTGTEAHSILFTTGSTNNFSSWSVSGSAGKLITINSTTTGTHNLVMSSSGSAISDYLNIQHSNATPSSRWFAGNNSVNNQLVTTAGSGWIFYSKTIYMGIGGTAGGEINNGVTGTGAAATAILTANVVTSVNVTSAGTNYNSTVISFCGGGGSGATGFAVLNSGSVASVTVSSGGSNYTTAPSILFGGMCGGGSGGGGDSEGGSGGGEGQGGGGGGGGGDLGFIFPKWHLAYIASPFLMMLFTLLG